MESLPHRLGFLILALATILAEYAWRTGSADRGYDRSGAFASFAMAFGNGLVAPINGAVIFAVFARAQSVAPFHLSAGDWRTWLLGFLAVEFAYYWFHRWSHGIRWLWATHAVHHSASELTLPSAVRLGWTNLISGGWLVFVPVVLAGFPAVVVTGLLAINLGFQFFLHTEAIGRLGPVEWIFNSPAHHRVHHARNPHCLDRNFGGVLIVFDRLFGTFAEAGDDEPLDYGLVHPIESHNPVRIALMEWVHLARDIRAAPDLRQRLRQMFSRPG